MQLCQRIWYPLKSSWKNKNLFKNIFLGYRRQNTHIWKYNLIIVREMCDMGTKSKIIREMEIRWFYNKSKFQNKLKMVETNYASYKASTYLVTLECKCEQDSYHRNYGNKIIQHYSLICKGKASTWYGNWEITCNTLTNIITCYINLRFCQKVSIKWDHSSLLLPL